MSLISALTAQPQGLIRPYQSKLQALAVFVDLSFIYWSLYLATSFWEMPLTNYYAWCAGLAIALFLFFSDVFGVYSVWRVSTTREELVRILGAWLSTVCVLTAIGFIFKMSGDFSRKAIGTWVLLAPVSLVFLHFSRRQLLAFLRRHGRNTRFYAVAGATSLGQTLHHKLESMKWLGYKFSGYYDDRQPVEARRLVNDSVNSIQGYEKLVADVKARKIDLVYITLPMKAEKRVQWLLRELADTTASVYIVPDFTVFDPVRARWNSIQGLPLVSVYDTPFGEFESFVKRAMDIVFSSLILCIIAIPMLIIAITIRLTSPGPIIFKQRRYGIDGKEINVWKFRSMNVVDNGAVVKQATKNDSRITPFGAFLRRTSLDELPQFINVLQGRMSVVGPRPHAVAHNEHYRTKVHGYMLRHKVKPGITGLAQVNGCRGETDTDEKMQARVKYDLQYINNWSLWLDLKIFLKTIFKGFLSKNAY